MNPARQQGTALLLALILAMLLGSIAYSRQVFSGALARAGGGREADQAAVLARAKDALIARAVTDDNRPGSLPCPDLATRSPGLNNYSGDGKADMFTLTQCPSYVGWLPWVTLDLPELTDDSGTRLWYALAPALRDDDSAHPIHSDTAPGLSLDGNPDIAALIIAPGPPLAGQARSALNPNLPATPADYLDGNNGLSGTRRYISGPPGEQFNDRILAITRQELMAAVEKRVAGAVRQCLTQHARAAGNPEQRLPWAAPINSAASPPQGQEGSRFGRIPATQPGAGPDAALHQLRLRLNDARQQLSAAQNTEAQATALELLNQIASQSDNLGALLVSSTSPLKAAADPLFSRSQALSAILDNAVLNQRISRTEGTDIRNAGGTIAQPLAALLEQLNALGIDPTPATLASQRLALEQAANASSLLDASQASANLLNIIHTPRSELATPLALAQQQASDARSAATLAASTGNANDLNAAREAARQLALTLGQLQNAIEATRASRTAGELLDALPGLDRQNADLAGSLRRLQQQISELRSGVSSITTARESASSSLNAVQQLLLTPSGSGTEINVEINTALEAARRDLQNLADALSRNAASDNHVARTSLQAAALAYEQALGAFTLVDTAATRPLQSQIVPYADTLNTATVNLAQWAKIIADNAAEISPLATAASSAGRDLASSINGRNGAAERLQAYQRTPSNDNLNLARTALNLASSRAELLDGALNTLDPRLDASNASAFPMLWASPDCAFLRPDQASWWRENQWHGSLFYQISAPLPGGAPGLSVNGQGSHRLVVLAAGKALDGQLRTRATSRDYLEAGNADSSRDGEARQPINTFTQRPPGTDFNDRLAY